MPINKRFLIVSALLVPSLTEPAALAQSVPQKLPNAVTCIYDALPQEQREVVQSMFEASVARGANPMEDQDVRQSLQGFIEHAGNACIDLYPWTSGKTTNASAFAIFSLARDNWAAGLKARGHDATDIERYYEDNKVRLRFGAVPNNAQAAALTAYLGPKGWDPGEPRLGNTAVAYFELLHRLDWFRRGFAENVLRPPPPSVVRFRQDAPDRGDGVASQTR